ncbi:hypothetical protein Dfulv_02155 [Dactylosporangium fulvum]|uniref:RNA polymerase sigma-70 region 2 domain-containing protein n=1 Tax=Dactylosporangium fulvum TaxID=53359 RepID=A0ABY5W1J3_9ACTN|nr:sigma factor [Dactylosporangium fulvum]UWP83134.1 hypothetical protein Dfulv_02155 [Dactylosporangium fulvum]
MDRQDDEGVTAFVRASYGRLLHEAFLLCGDAGRAEDLVQTTLAKTVVVWSRLQRSEGIDNYVQRTLINTYLSARRRRAWWEQPFSRLVERPHANKLPPSHCRSRTSRARRTTPTSDWT